MLYAIGHHDFPLKIFCFSAETFRRGSFLCFRKFLISKNVRDKREGGYHDFLSKLFCLTVPNHLVEKPFCVSASFGYGKILCLRGEYHDFLPKICCTTVLKNFVREPLCFTKLLEWKNFMNKRGEGRGGEGGSITIFYQKFLSHRAEKFRSGTLLSFRKFLVTKNVRDRRRGEGGSITIFFQNFFVSLPKNFLKEPFFTKFGYRKILCLRGLCHNILLKFFCLAVPKNFVREPSCAVFQRISVCEKVYG